MSGIQLWPLRAPDQRGVSSRSVSMGRADGKQAQSPYEFEPGPEDADSELLELGKQLLHQQPKGKDALFKLLKASCSSRIASPPPAQGRRPADQAPESVLQRAGAALEATPQDSAQAKLAAGELAKAVGRKELVKHRDKVRGRGSAGQGAGRTAARARQQASGASTRRAWLCRRCGSTRPAASATCCAFMPRRRPIRTRSSRWVAAVVLCARAGGAGKADSWRAGSNMESAWAGRRVVLPPMQWVLGSRMPAWWAPAGGSERALSGQQEGRPHMPGALGRAACRPYLRCSARSMRSLRTPRPVTSSFASPSLRRPARCGGGRLRRACASAAPA